MSDFKNKPGSGSFFDNFKKNSDKSPDFTGKFTNEKDEIMDISVWKKNAANGKSYYSFTIRPEWKPMNTEGDKKNKDISKLTGDLPF